MSSISLLKKLGWFIATGAGTGLSPIAPGTVGSGAALLIYLALPISGSSPFLLLLILIGLISGIWATGTFATTNNPDPRKAVWD